MTVFICYEMLLFFKVSARSNCVLPWSHVTHFSPAIMSEYHEPHSIIALAYVMYYSHTVAIQQYVRDLFQIDSCVASVHDFSAIYF